MPRPYDPDFDDTPPPSPVQRASRPVARPLWRWRRSRALLTVVTVVGLLYLFFRPHRPWTRSWSRPFHAPSLSYKDVDWRQFAYSLYAPDGAHLCNAMMVFEALDRLGSKAQKLLIYTEELDLDVASSRDRDSQLLVRARDWYGVHLLPEPRPFATDEVDPATDQQMRDKVAISMIFNQTQFSRIIHLDGDVIVQRHLDELFLLPSATVAMPRAYWKQPAENELTPFLTVLEPSEAESTRVYEEPDLPSLYRSSAMVLPHRPYALISGEFRHDNHSAFLGNEYEEWDGARARREASLIHFADWPLPKPWIMWPMEQMLQMRPPCRQVTGLLPIPPCQDRNIWLSLYDEFRKQRKEICGLLSIPAPEWPPKKTEDA